MFVSYIDSESQNLRVDGRLCHHGYGSSMISAVTGNFRPSRVLPRPGFYDNAVNSTMAAGSNAIVAMIQI